MHTLRRKGCPVKQRQRCGRDAAEPMGLAMLENLRRPGREAQHASGQRAARRPYGQAVSAASREREAHAAEAVAARRREAEDAAEDAAEAAEHARLEAEAAAAHAAEEQRLKVCMMCCLQEEMILPHAWQSVWGSRYDVLVKGVWQLVCGVIGTPMSPVIKDSNEVQAYLLHDTVVLCMCTPLLLCIENSEQLLHAVHAGGRSGRRGCSRSSTPGCTGKEKGQEGCEEEALTLLQHHQLWHPSPHWKGLLYALQITKKASEGKRMVRSLHSTCELNPRTRPRTTWKRQTQWLAMNNIAHQTSYNKVNNSTASTMHTPQDKVPLKTVSNMQFNALSRLASGRSPELL